MFEYYDSIAAIVEEREFLSSGPDEPNDSERAATPGKGEASQPQGRILIVEDETFAVLYIADILAEGGYEVIGSAATADEAIAKSDAERPDLVIMDIRLVGARDGVYAAQEIYRRFGIRSLFVSAYSDAQTRQRAGAAQPTGFVEKPFSPETLLSAVRASF